MKKFTRTGKKTLSVFLAALMVMTAWVFVAPQKALAATTTSGAYYYKVTLQVTGGDPTNLQFKTTLYGKSEHGTNSSETQIATKDYTSNTNFSVNTTYDIMEGTTSAGVFPTRLYLYDNNGAKYKLDRSIKAYWHIYVGNDESNLTEVYLDAFCESQETEKTEVISGKGAYWYWQAKNLWVGGSANYFKIHYSVNSDYYPTASKVVWTQSPSDITIANSTTAKSYCADQYGVRLPIDPTYSFSSSSTAGLSGARTLATDGASYKVTADNNARMSGEGNNERDVTITATYPAFNGNTPSSDTATKTFKVIDPTHTTTINANGGTLKTTAAISRQWGDKYNVTPDAIYNGYTLIGFYQTKQGPFLNENTPTGTKLSSDYIVTGNTTWYAAWRANKYTATFNYRDASYAQKSEEKTQYYTSTLTAPTIPTKIETTDYTYTFTGWNPSVPSTMPASDQTYTANYSQKENYADYTEVVKQISAGDLKKAEKVYQEGGYTPETVSAFETAYNLAVNSNNNKLLKSQQKTVDELAATLKTAIENLKLKTYTVVFVDESGAIIKDGFFYVNYGEEVTPPSSPEKESDHTNHYTFTAWDSDSDALSACDYVTDDLKYIAKFTATEHDFETETVASTCTEDGVIKKTCKTCGYSYTETSTDLAHHTWVENTVVKAATCAENGITATQCSVCKVYKADSIKPVEKTAHSFGSWTEYTPATCAGKGTQVRECTVCHTKEIQDTAKIAHTFGETTVVAPTCTAEGYSKHTCSMCGLVEIFDVKSATGHTATTEIKNATCVSIGYKKTVCSACGHTTVEDIPATGVHSFGNWETVTEATCISNGVEERTCSVCKTVETNLTNMTEHDWGEAKVYAEATCTSDRIDQYTCSICKQTKTETIENTNGHTWNTTPTIDRAATCTAEGQKSIHCSVCNTIKEDSIESIAKIDHSYVETSTTATCTTAGVATKECSVCGHTVTEVTPALGHDFEATNVVAATCKDAGHATMVCKNNCGKSYEEYTDPATQNHNWEYTVSEPSHGTITVTGTCLVCGATFTKTVSSTHEFENVEYEYTPATCQAEGSIKITCGVPDCTENHTITLDKNPNAHTEYTYEETKPATCTEKGTVTVKCNACDTVVQTVTLPAKGHDYSDTYKEYEPATCKTEGHVTYECTVCHVEKTDTLPVVAYAHSYELIEVVDPTCTSNGYTLYRCEYCGNEYKELGDAPVAHVYEKQSTSTEPSCYQAGHYYFKCKTCTAAYDYEVPATGNHKVEGKVTQAQTCTLPEITTYTCTEPGCTYDYIEVTKNPLGHSFGEWVTTKEPTETEDGEQQRTCKNNCGETETAPIPAKIHNWGETPIKTTAATCTAAKTETYECIGCDLCNETNGYATYVKTVGVPLEHNVVIDYVAPTCEEDGSYVVSCTLCKKEFAKENLPAIGHSYDEEHKKVEDATCTAEGKITYTCTRTGCGKTIEITLAKLQHEYNYWDYSVAPTCTTEGYQVWICTCGAQKFVKTEEKLDHSKTRTERKEATCTAEGYDRTVCEYCGKILEEETIAKLSHTEKVVEIAATCTEKGSKTTICSVCKTVLRETEYTPALDHDWGEWEVLVEGTCAVEGKKQRKCKRDGCGETEYIDSGIGNHVYGEGVTTPATCTENAFITYTCTVCNNGTKIKYLDGTKLGHKYSADYKIIVNPTCHSTGTKAHYCIRCGTFEQSYVEIPELAHTYGEWEITKKPTCDTNGEKVRTCTGGCSADHLGHTETAAVPKDGHNYGEWEITKKATCLEEGSQRRYCDRCKTWEVQAIPTGGHTRVADYAVEATCTSTGHTAGSHCSVCGYVFVATEEIPMKNHYDLGGDGKCDTCGKLMTNSEGVDTCFCHKTGFAGIFYRLFVRVIWKIFKVNQTCVCGVEHYETKKK